MKQLYITSVYFLVFLEMVMPNESFSTFFTLVAFIIMMDTKMKPVETKDDVKS